MFELRHYGNESLGRNAHTHTPKVIWSLWEFMVDHGGYNLSNLSKRRWHWHWGISIFLFHLGVSPTYQKWCFGRFSPMGRTGSYGRYPWSVAAYPTIMACEFGLFHSCITISHTFDIFVYHRFTINLFPRYLVVAMEGTELIGRRVSVVSMVWTLL